MKKNLFTALACSILFLAPNVNFAQVVNLGAASSFAVFTAAGAFENAGTTIVTGDIGTNVGAFTGFPPGIVIGQIHVADVVSAQAAADVDVAYSYLGGITCGAVIGTTLGNNQVLTPNVYCTGAASSLNGDLILDAQGDANAVFIFKIDGALSTGTLANVVLINSASLCNVYWQVNGAFSLGEGSVFRGTVVANGAIHLLEASSLFGRALSRAGAIDLHNNKIAIAMPPMASIITAGGPTTFCSGDSVILSGNAGGTWNNGMTGLSITVKTSGDYFVTTTNGCGTVTSNHITVTVNPLPVCSIACGSSICPGQSTELCAAVGTNVTYLWSTGATTRCITVNATGTYSVTVKNAAGCSSTCSKTITATAIPVCSIAGNTVICPSKSTQLCAAVGTNVTYLWSTGATTRCITVNTAGTYSVTIKTPGGCSSTCSKTVTVSPLPACSITGNTVICTGQSTQLCVAAGFSGYLWNTGSTSRCITVRTPGTYSVTVKNAAGCSNTCSVTVTASKPKAARVSVGNTVMPADMIINAYPNPFTSKAVIEFQLPAAGHVVIALYNTMGNKVATLFDKQVTAGVLYKAEINGAKLPAGMYIYKTMFGDRVINNTIVLTK